MHPDWISLVHVPTTEHSLWWGDEMSRQTSSRPCAPLLEFRCRWLSQSQRGFPIKIRRLGKGKEGGVGSEEVTNGGSWESLRMDGLEVALLREEQGRFPDHGNPTHLCMQHPKGVTQVYKEQVHIDSQKCSMSILGCEYVPFFWAKFLEKQLHVKGFVYSDFNRYC